MPNQNSNSLVPLQQPSVPLNGNGLSPSVPLAPPVPPGVGKEMKKWLEQYAADMELMRELFAKIKALAAGLKNTGNVMAEVIQIFALFQNAQGEEMKVLSDVDNIDSTLRGELSQAQKDWNEMQGGKASAQDPGFKPSPASVQAALRLKEVLARIEAFISYEKKLGKGSALDGSTLKTLEDAIKGIKSSFGSAWGDPTAMASETANWMYAVEDQGASVPQMKNISNDFQTLNQTVSELSSSTNTQLQFEENLFKQSMGMQNGAQQVVEKLDATMIRHQTAS